MQEYGAAFAKIYNRLWGGFAERIAPAICVLYEGAAQGEPERVMLDLACGTGQLAAHFLAQGYRVMGVDRSVHMLAHARENNEQYVAEDQATFIQADMRHFDEAVDEQVGLAVCTYDALNHLPDADALGATFRAVRAVLKAGGMFVFDLNTRSGLYERWNNLMVQDSEDFMIVNRGIFDGESDRAYVRFSGFIRQEDGDLYERFAESFYNTVFPMAVVSTLLADAGYSEAYVARGDALDTPVDDAEALSRAFFVAW